MPKSEAASKQLKEDNGEAAEDTEEITIHKPFVKSPFKAIRGDGNSFHGWCL